MKLQNKKKYYQYITEDGNIDLQEDNNSIFSNNLKEIGNYFETEEEAKKAVEKLKAWKRLKEGGVKFDLATLSDDTTIVMFARKKKHVHDYDKEIFMLFEDKE